MTITAIDKLSQLLNSLKLSSVDVDKKNESNNAHRLLENKDLFSEHLFRTKSDKFYPYLLEIEQNIKNLNFVLSKSNNDISFALIKKIETQLNAIFNAFTANNVIHKEAAIRQDKLKKTRYKNMAKKIMTSSHELYKKLSEYHEFERRLVAMLNEKNLQINKTNNTQQHTQDILTLHQRLGRCRQAISKVEREIEINEKSF